MKSTLTARLNRMHRELTERLSRVDADIGGTQGPLSAVASERATEVANDEVLERIGDSTRAELERVDAALARLASGWQLTCTVCGKPIEADRLRAVPYAFHCAACSQHE